MQPSAIPIQNDNKKKHWTINKVHLVLLFGTTVNFFIFKILQDIDPFFGATDAPILDFCWRLPWPRVDPLTCMFRHLRATESSNSPLVRHLLTSWWPAWQPSCSNPCTVQALVGLESGMTRRSTDWAMPARLVSFLTSYKFLLLVCGWVQRIMTWTVFSDGQTDILWIGWIGIPTNPLVDPTKPVLELGEAPTNGQIMSALIWRNSFAKQWKVSNNNQYAKT